MESRSRLFTRRRLLGTAAATAAAGALTRSPTSALAEAALSPQASNVFTGSDQLYLTFGTALKDLVADSAGEELRALNGVVALEFAEPAARITVALNPAQATVAFGDSQRTPDVTLALPGDLAHALASGQLPIEDAVVDPDLRWTAQPPEKVRALIGLPQSLTPFYLRALDDTGHAELVPKPSPPVFPTEQDLYETLGEAVRGTVSGAPEAKTFRQVGKVIAMRFSDPQGEVNLRLTDRPAVSFGSSTETPDAVVRMSGDTAHRLFSGSLGFTEAVGRGHLTYEGKTGALARLAALPATVRPRYRCAAPG